MRWSVVLAAAIVIASLSACGGSSSSSTVRPTPSPTPIGLHAANWHFDSVDGAHLSILVESGTPSCWKVEPPQVSETDDSVTILAYTSEIHTGLSPTIIDNTFYGQVCTLELRFIPTELTLSKPLGDRALLGCVAGFGDNPPTGADCRLREWGRN